MDAVLLDAPTAGGAERGRLAAGQDFALLDLTGGWAWGYSLPDHVVGYITSDVIEPASMAA